MLNTAQFGDNVEQFNWAQSLELGYHKHPPLPSWLLGAVIRVAGPSIYWAYVLAATCLIGAMVFGWLLGRELIGPVGATAAALLSGLNMNFAQRAQLYNHNTVLLLFVAATAWLAWRASSASGRTRLAWWMLTGAAAAGAVLSKYQALVPLAGVIIFLAATGRLSKRSDRRGLIAAVGTMVLLCLPHGIWMVEHDYPTLRYASEAVADSTGLQRIGFVVSFVANQLRLWSPAVLAALLLAAANRFRRGRLPAEQETAVQGSLASATDQWSIGLLWFDLVVLLIMALGLGVSLRNHWGVQTLQYLALWVVSGWQRRSRLDLGRLMWAVLMVHVLNLTWYAVEHRHSSAVLAGRRIDTSYPAQRLADAAVAHWHAHIGCSLRYVAGTAFDAGLVSLYSGGTLRVFDNEAATPWIAPSQLRARGAVYVLDAADSVPAGVVDLIDFPLASPAGASRTSRSIRIGLRYPSDPCDDTKAAVTETPLRQSS